MEPELFSEWRLFEKVALEQLRNFGIKEISKFRLLEVMKLPSFYYESIKRWALCEDMVLRFDWLCQNDYKKFNNITQRAKYLKEISPTIRYKAIKVEENYSQSIMEELLKLRIPIILNNNIIGRDGVSYEIEFGGFLYDIKLRWWEDVPYEWKEIQCFTRRIIRDFDNMLKDEEYADLPDYSGKLWLKPVTNTVITEEMVNFLKQFSGFKKVDVTRIYELLRLQKRLFLEPNYSHKDFTNIKIEFDRLGLDIEFI
ncbi:MAG: hypothetical protein N2645_18650 [Clostridia bacterium]|nr:hypothetical protein [Clostridia bacterium]